MCEFPYFCLLTPFMTRAIYLFAGFIVLLAGCTQRMVCPAYQSAFIYDKDELRKKFSYFVGDSTPKVYTASKSKYLIAEQTSYHKKVRSLQTVPMKKVMVVVPDSISGNNEDSVITAELDAAARSVIDSTFIPDLPAKDSIAEEEQDSTYVISKDREVRVLKYNMPDSLEYDSVSQKYVRQKPAYYVDEVGFNTEQDNYMWYLRRSLVLPDVRLAKTQGKAGGSGGTAEKVKQKKGFFGFFKNLFKKKKTEDIDSAEIDINQQQDEFNFIDTTAQEEPIERVDQPKQKKKGFLSRDKDDQAGDDVTDAATAPIEKPKKKKKRKSADKTPATKPEEEKKKPEDDDGF
jgi:hypothetical protein